MPAVVSRLAARLRPAPSLGRSREIPRPPPDTHTHCKALEPALMVTHGDAKLSACRAGAKNWAKRRPRACHLTSLSRLPRRAAALRWRIRITSCSNAAAAGAGANRLERAPKPQQWARSGGGRQISRQKSMKFVAIPTGGRAAHLHSQRAVSGARPFVGQPAACFDYLVVLACWGRSQEVSTAYGRPASLLYANPQPPPPLAPLAPLAPPQPPLTGPNH